MLTAQDLKPPKKEYWFNVYHNGKIYGLKYGTLEMAIVRGHSITGVKLLYRIHVRLK